MLSLLLFLVLPLMSLSVPTLPQHTHLSILTKVKLGLEYYVGSYYNMRSIEVSVGDDNM